MAPMFCKFTSEMQDDVKFYINNGGPTMGATSIHGLLQAKYPGRYISNKQLYNSIQQHKALQPSVIQRDSTDLLNTLQKNQCNNSEWYYQAKFSEDDGRLMAIFWMSPEQKQLYYRYHDCLINDSTYKKNQYDMTLNVFVCIDSDNKTRLVASALIDDETENSFSWILQNLYQATNFIEPKDIFTDGDPSFAKAIKTVFSNTLHFVCIYHIEQNLKRKLKGKLGSNYDQFKKEFYKARNSLCIIQFESLWNQLKDDWAETSNYLNRTLEPIKTSWASYIIFKENIYSKYSKHFSS